jgi:hypothetical protein
MPAFLTAIATSPHLVQNRASSVRSPPHRLQILFVMFLSFLLVSAQTGRNRYWQYLVVSRFAEAPAPALAEI